MSKHTPGKWEIKYSPAYSINTDDRHIAMVSCYKASAKDEEENLANARLISAAPDLLQACKEAKEWFKREFDVHKKEGNDLFADKYIKPLLDTLKQAIAKAENPK